MLWCELTAPPLSCIHRDIDQMAELASQALFDEINHLSGAPLTRYADVELILRDSTRIIDNGPLGEHAVSPDSIRLSKEEKQLFANWKLPRRHLLPLHWNCLGCPASERHPG